METYSLNNEDIAKVVALVEEQLQGTALKRPDILRVTLLLEEILLQYQEKFGKEHLFQMLIYRRLRQLRVELRIQGESFDPISQEGEEYLQRLLSELGLSPTWKYHNGENRLLLTPPRKKLPQLLQMAISIVLAIGCGLMVLCFPEEGRTFLSETIVTPVFDTIMGMLTAVAAPMIFCTVVSGVGGMGNIAVFRRIGSRTMVGFLLWSAVALGIVTALLIPFATFSEGESGASALDGVVNMLLDIFPDNLLTPFTNGNTMQIIFMGLVLGVALLVLDMKVDYVRTFVVQMETIVQMIMRGITAVLPIFVFLSIFNMIIQNSFSVLLESYRIPLFALGGAVLLLLFFLLKVCIQVRISPIRFLRKVMPGFLIGLTTCSTAAAFPTNLETSKNRLGVQERLTRFGLPLGQVIFMPTAGMHFLVCSFCLADLYQVSISVSWVIMAFLVCFILSVALPPIPGGSLTCYTLLFTQLGIPSDAIAIVVALDTILDMMATPCDIFCVQAQLTCTASSLKMLDREKLKA